MNKENLNKYMISFFVRGIDFDSELKKETNKNPEDILSFVKWKKLLRIKVLFHISLFHYKRNLNKTDLFVLRSINEGKNRIEISSEIKKDLNEISRIYDKLSNLRLIKWMLASNVEDEFFYITKKYGKYIIKKGWVHD
jgi:hypothetical protein